MKNLPEQEAFKNLENKLRDYTEQPDDDLWDKIATEVPQHSVVWISWANGLSLAASLLLLLWLMNYDRSTTRKISSVDRVTTLNNQTNNVRQFKTNNDSMIVENHSLTLNGNVKKKSITIKTESSAFLFNSKNEGYIASPLSNTTNSITKSITKHFPLQKNDQEILATVSKADQLSTNKILTADSLIIEKINSEKTDSATTQKSKDVYNKRKKKHNGFHLYALITPTLSFQTVTPKSSDNVVVQSINTPSILSMDRFGIGFDFGLQGRISGRLEYLGGLSFYHQSQSIRYSYSDMDHIIIDNGTGDGDYIVKPESQNGQMKYKMTNIGVRAGFLYTIKAHQLIHKVGATVGYQKGFAKTNENHFYNNASSAYLNYTLLYRVEFAINSKFDFLFQPSATGSLHAHESLQTPFTLKQYRAGISVGLIYHY